MDSIDTLADRLPLLLSPGEAQRRKMARLREEDLDFLASHTASDR